MKALIAFTLIAASTLLAQDLLPELVPHVNKYRRETGDLTEKRPTALESSKTTYLEALNTADAAATKAGTRVPIF
jgi:hypothetical protein